MRAIRAVLLALLAWAAGMQLARADIYTWVDANGVTNVSNVGPPDGARVTAVTHETPQAAASRYDAAREAARQAEVQALADRVRQLETQVEIAQRPAPPSPATVAYVPVATPVFVPYETEPAAAPATRGCDPTWYGCWASGWGFFPPSIIVLSGANVRHHPNGAHRPDRISVPRPVSGAWHFRRP